MEPVSEPTDDELVRLACAGERDALERLLVRHEPWIFNVALRMLRRREDAEDATQDVLIRVARGLSGFRGDASPSTWIRRVAVNQVRSAAARRARDGTIGFAEYGARIAACPDEELSADELPVSAAAVVEEARLACTTGMLMCLDREQRLALILGAILGLDAAVAAELLEIRPDAFRQRLARARADLRAFMEGQCGLVDPRNPCRCARKTRAFIRAGVVDPSSLRFARDHVARVREAVPTAARDFADGLQLFRDEPFHEAPGLTRAVLDRLVPEPPRP